MRVFCANFSFLATVVLEILAFVFDVKFSAKNNVDLMIITSQNSIDNQNTSMWQKNYKNYIT